MRRPHRARRLRCLRAAARPNGASHRLQCEPGPALRHAPAASASGRAGASRCSPRCRSRRPCRRDQRGGGLPLGGSPGCRCRASLATLRRPLGQACGARLHGHGLPGAMGARRRQCLAGGHRGRPPRQGLYVPLHGARGGSRAHRRPEAGVCREGRALLWLRGLRPRARNT